MDESLHPIYTRYIDKRSQKKRLSVVLKECVKFDALDVQHDEDKAKSALIDFFETFLREKPDKKLKIGWSYYSYFMRLMPLRQAIIDKQYSLACHELLDLCAFEPYLQKRIYVCLDEIYRHYLKSC